MQKLRPREDVTYTKAELEMYILYSVSISMHLFSFILQISKFFLFKYTK